MLGCATLSRLSSSLQVVSCAASAPAQRPCTAAAACTTSDAAPCSRRDAVSLAVSLAAAFLLPWRPHAAAAVPDQRLLQAFQAAMAAPDAEAAEQAWSRAIEIAPENGPAFSNRGTVRLQNGRWQAAKDDFLRALDLEAAAGTDTNAALLNNLGNAEGALGDWTAAQAHFQQAAQNPEMESIAYANLALAFFETRQDGEAIKVARQLLRRDASFLDMRCALAAFLWATGQRSEAEEQYEELQEAQDGIGGALYSKATAVQRVQNRWPPRATAALRAFLSMASEGTAEGYDGRQHTYKF